VIFEVRFEHGASRPDGARLRHVRVVRDYACASTRINARPAEKPDENADRSPLEI
jgi:hypothetical protein